MRIRLGAAAGLGAFTALAGVAAPAAASTPAIDPAYPGDTTGRVVLTGTVMPGGCEIDIYDTDRVSPVLVGFANEPSPTVNQPLTAVVFVGADGRFSLPLLDGHYQVFNHTCPAGGRYWDSFDVPAGGGVDVGDLFVARPAPERVSVTGHVTGPEGAGVPGAHVTLRDTSGDVSGDGLTDASGSYTAAVPPGTYLAWVQTDGQSGAGSVLAAGALVVGPSGAQLDAGLPRSVPLSGVVSRDGQPVGNPYGTAVACLVGLDGVSVPPDSCAAMASGAYSFAGVAPGHYQLRVDDGRTDPLTGDSAPLVREVTVAPADTSVEADIVRSSAGDIFGTVVDPAGNPVVGITVDAIAPDNRSFQASTDSRGEWGFQASQGLDAGVPLTIRIGAESNTKAPNQAFLTMAGGYYAGAGRPVAATAPGARTVVTGAGSIDLGRAVIDSCASVSGVVDERDALFARYPFGGAYAAITSSDGVFERVANVLPDGSFQVAGLQPGDYYVAVEVAGSTVPGPRDYTGTQLSTLRYLWGADPFQGAPAPLHVGPGCASVRGLQLTTSTPAAGDIVTAAPARMLDVAVQGFAAPLCRRVTGADVPDGAAGVLVNVTSVSPASPGNVLVFPDDGAQPAVPPNAVSVSFDLGRDVAGSAFVPIGANGRICVYSQSWTTSRVLVDITGFTMPGSGLVLEASQRLVDTRSGGYHVGDLAGALAPRTPYDVVVAGRVGVPADAAAVIVDVTAVQPRDVGNLRVYPSNDGGAAPTVSTLNYAPGSTKTNATVVPLAGGRISLYSDTSAPVDVVLDVVGYVAHDGAAYHPVPPTRVLDTRSSAAPEVRKVTTLHAGTAASLDLGASGALPAGATAVVLNVTAIGPTTVGNLRVYPESAGTGSIPPNASTINYIAGRDIPNLVVVGVSPDGRIDLYSDQLSGGTVDLAIDVLGYVSAAP